MHRDADIPVLSTLVPAHLPEAARRPPSHAARLRGSLRLQRVLSVLVDGGEHSTREILRAADVCAVNSIVHELRCNGIPIHCRCERGIYYYRLGAAR